MLGKFKKHKRLRTHGFLTRSKTPNGRKVLRERRQKGRYELTPSYARCLKPANGKSKLHIIAGGTARFIVVAGSNQKLRAR